MITRNYTELSEAWQISAADIKAARTKLGDRLVEGLHFQRGEQNALLFTPEGENLLMQGLGIDPIEHGNMTEGEFADFLAEQTIAMMAPAIALRAYQLLPQRVMGEMRRMLHQPKNQDEVEAVSNALNLYAARIPGFLPGGQA